MPKQSIPDLIFDDVQFSSSNLDFEPCPHCQGFGFLLYLSTVSGDSCAASPVSVPVEASGSVPNSFGEGSLCTDTPAGQGGN